MRVCGGGGGRGVLAPPLSFFCFVCELHESLLSSYLLIINITPARVRCGWA